MERETKEIIIPVGKNKIIIKSWLTGRERRAIRSVLLEEVKFGQTGEGEVAPEYNIQGSVLNKAQDKAFESVIVSIDGNSDDIVNNILDMRDKDFDFVVKEIDEVTGGTSEEDKKK